MLSQRPAHRHNFTGWFASEVDRHNFVTTKRNKLLEMAVSEKAAGDSNGVKESSIGKCFRVAQSSLKDY